MDWAKALAAIFTLALAGVGLLGIVTPFFPGIHLVWFAVFLYAVVTDFAEITPGFLGFSAVLVLLTYALDFWSIRWGLKELRVTWWGVAGATVGSLIGLFFGLFPALTIGPILGAVVGEMATGRDSVFAIETEEMKFVGFIGSSLVKIVIGLVIIGSWLAVIRG